MGRLKVTQVEPLRNYKLRLVFSDGHTTVYDARPLIDRGGELFGPLRGAAFAEVAIDPVSGAVCWPNGADLDTYVLRGQIPTWGGKREGAGRTAAEPTERVSVRLPTRVVEQLKRETGESSSGLAVQAFITAKSGAVASKKRAPRASARAR